MFLFIKKHFWILAVFAVPQPGAFRVLQELGNLLEAMTKANDDKPPIGAAWDGGGGNFIINSAFLGLVSSLKMHLTWYLVVLSYLFVHVFSVCLMFTDVFC